MELHRKDTSCIEVLLHPLLRTLEVIWPVARKMLLLVSR